MHRGKYIADVIYRGYGPMYTALYILYSTVSAQQTNLLPKKS